MDDKTIVREYRRGKTYRHGNIDESKFLTELKFDKVTYSNTLSEDEKTKGLNYTYDALNDLSEILDVPPFILSLRDNEGNKSVLHIGQKVDNRFNLLSNLEGNFGYNWFKFLDAFLGIEDGYTDGIIAHLGESQGFYADKVKKTLMVLKYRPGLPTDNENIREEVKKRIEEIMEIIDSMPLLDVETPEEYNTLENSRDNFISQMDLSSFFAMKQVFSPYEEANAVLNNPIIIENLNAIERINNDFSKSNVDLVETDFYKLAKSLDTEQRYKKYSSDLELFAFVFNYYLLEKLREIDGYNNFLASSPDDNLLKIENKLEETAIFNSIGELLENIIPMVSENIYILDEEENTVVETDIEDGNISDADTEVGPALEQELDEDKDKFKITLFKKLLKEKGFDLVDEIPIVSSCHYVTVKNSYIKYIKPPVRLYSQDKNQRIIIDCIDIDKENSKVTEEYDWDYALDYNDLVDYLYKLHLAHQRVDSMKERNVINKFEVMKFRESCKAVGLKLKPTDSRVNEGFYNFEFDTSKGSAIRHVITKETYDKGKNRVVVKMQDSSKQYIEWTGKPNYLNIAKQILDIEKKYLNVIEPEEKNTKLVDEHKKAKNKQLFMTLCEVKDISNKEDLRKRMLKFVSLMTGTTTMYFGYDLTIKAINSHPMGANIRYNLAPIPKGEEEGRSKIWKKVSENNYIIGKKSDERKMVEGAIESFVTSIISSLGVSGTQKTVYVEGLTYMLCKYLKLDVRTYCQGSEFDKLLKNKSVLSKYFNQLFRVYMQMVSVFRV